MVMLEYDRHHRSTQDFYYLIPWLMDISNKKFFVLLFIFQFRLLLSLLLLFFCFSIFFFLNLYLGLFSYAVEYMGNVLKMIL